MTALRPLTLQRTVGTTVFEPNAGRQQVEDLPNAQQVRANVRCKLLLPRFRTELGRGPRHSRGEMRSSSARRLGHRGPIKAPVAPAPGPECETRRARVGAGAGSVEPAASLDINDVDTGLRAAPAAMSRATSGIKYDEGRSGANYGLHQGQTVDETGPDGRLGACASCRLHSDAG